MLSHCALGPQSPREEIHMGEEPSKLEGLWALLPAVSQVCFSFPALFHCLKTAVLVEGAEQPCTLIVSKLYI